MSIRSFLIAGLSSFVLFACGSEPTSQPKTIATVEISDLYIKAPAPGRDITGGGLKITAVDGDFRLISASSEAADIVELHTMALENDIMRMRKVEGYDIAAGETFVLEPGGPHLMLFGFDTDLQAGDTAEMLFTFENPEGESVTLNYPAEIRGRGEH